MVSIITDSTSDLGLERAGELGVEMVPLSVHFGEEAYLDGIDLTSEEFYKRLEVSEQLPTTSQVSPETFAQVFRKYLDQGDEIVGLFISADMSGTRQSAGIAREMVDGEDKIFLLESGTVTFALGLLVETAVQLREEGLSAREIAERMEKLIPRVRLLAAVNTLKYLKMGGRISTATALVGGLLGITPIITIKDGLVASIGKARGRKAALQWIAERIKETPADLSLPVAFGYTADPAAMAECEEILGGLVEGTRKLEMTIGSVVGTHVGPGAAGIAYFTKE